MSSDGARPSFLMSTTHIPPYNPSTSRSSSNAGRSDAEESADDSEDFLEIDDLDDHDRSSTSLNRLGPATPKSSHNWPFSSLTSTASHLGTFPDGHAQNRRKPSLEQSGTSSSHQGDAMDNDRAEDAVEPPHIPASSLPHEILLHILRLLPPTALAPALRVCKAWCQCGVELLWHKPMFTSLPALYKMLQVLSQHQTQTFPYPEFVRRINFSNLTQEMSDKMLVKLLPCTGIERLTLTGCKNLSSASMVELLRQCTRLVALDLSEVEHVDDEVVTALAENCPRLQGLNLTGCGFVTDRGMEKLALGCPALRRIKLRKCDLVTDVSIVLLSLHCPLLLEVDLGLCFSISSTSLQQLLRSSHNLRELCLNSCSSLTDEGFPNATSLTLASSPATHHHSSSYSSAQASPLPSGSSGSSSSNPSRPSSPGPSPLIAPSGLVVRRPIALDSGPPLHSFDHLRYLDLTSLALLSDQAIAGIVRFMPKIRNLILAKCTRLTDESLYEICKVGKHLHYLHLGHVNSITDKAVTAIARNCTRLRYIDLACCNNLTDVSVLELAQNLPRLKRIGLVRVTNITDASLDALHARTSLERIHLSYCSNLTVAGVNDLLQHLPRLTHLSLTEVRAFRKKVLQVFCRPPPKDFNDHQRRSFCVFSGRGVHDLRRYLRSLSPSELAMLAQPDPPSDTDDRQQQQQHPLHHQHHHHLQQQQQHALNQQQLWGRQQLQHQAHQFRTQLDQAAITAATPPGQGTANQLAQARARLAQLAQTRTTTIPPRSNGNGSDPSSSMTTAVGGGGGFGLGAAFDPNATISTGRSDLDDSPRAHGTMRARQAHWDQPQASSSASSSGPSSPVVRAVPGAATTTPPNRQGFGATAAGGGTTFRRPSLDRQNSLGLSGPVDMQDLTEGPIPIRMVPSTSTNSMDLDREPSSSGTSTRPSRPRRATVTRTNYRSSNHRRSAGGMHDDDDGEGEEDEAGEETGEEEDLTMGEA
ncbi:uncharacterized protein JCM15063_005539 [Sporobolomyces koalae]|uniref:uncharacterized protein n=1 Tax=Sporobolomyces koalae TaxID=500713 RepID=UPI00317B1BCA